MKIKNVIALTAALTMLGISTVSLTASAETTYIVNETFENGLGSFKSFKDNLSVKGDALYIDRSTVEFWYVAGCDMTLTPGSTYILEFDAMAEQEGMTFRPEFETVEGCQPVCTLNSAAVSTSEFTHITGSFFVPEYDAESHKNTLWFQTSGGDNCSFYLDNVKIYEQEKGEINDFASLKTALTTGGSYDLTSSFTADEQVSLKGSDSSITGRVKGNSNTITYSSKDTPMFYVEAPATWEFSDINFSGGSYFFNIYNTSSNLTLNNCTFDTSSDTDKYSIANHNGTLTLNNVTFPERTDNGYDIVSDWGCGDNIFTGATKARVNRVNDYYNVYVTGLTKGADLFIDFATENDYNKVKGQTISDDLEMICNDEDLTIEIKDKETPNFSGEVTNVVAATGTGDYSDTVATAFETKISNSGGKGTISEITWIITSNNETKSTTHKPTDLTIDKNAAASIVLIVNGLYETQNNTAVVIK